MSFTADPAGYEAVEDSGVKTVGSSADMSDDTETAAENRDAGETENEQSVVNPQAGGDRHIELWIILLTVIAAGAVTLFLIFIRRNYFGK